MDHPLVIGAAEVEFTPPIGLLMDGYMARTEPSIGVHDPLKAQVLVLEHQGRRAALVTLDIMAVSRRFTDGVRADLAVLLDTEPGAILVCASHTHAGPQGLQDWFPIGEAALDQTFTAKVRERIHATAQQALEHRQPVELRVNSGEVSGIGGDRNRPERPVDPRVTVFSFTAEGEPVAILFHYACHPTVLPATNRLTSADFPGAARERIRERYPNAVCLFVNGAAGNVSTRFHRHDQTFAEVARLGQLLGERVIDLIGAATPAAPGLDWAHNTLELPLRTFPADARDIEPSGNARIDTVRREGAQIEAQLRRAFAGRTTQPAEICALRIGMLTLLSVPGEAFNDLAQALPPSARVAGYANDYIGYFPTQTAIDDATYEALSSPYDARAHELLASGLLDLLHRLEKVG